MATRKLGRLFVRGDRKPARRGMLAALAGALAAGALLAAPALASAAQTLYWSNESSSEGGVSSAALPGGSATEVLGLEEATGLALDPAAGKLYVASYSGEIKARPLAGGTPSTVISEGEGIDGIALDETAGKIYWVNEDSGAVRSANLDGSGVETVYEEASTQPVGIAVDAHTGKLYWGEWAARKVMVANLDGSEAHALYTGGETEGVQLDPTTGKLYWADPYAGQIMVGTATGEPAEALYTESEGKAAYPWGVAIDPVAGRIYWTDESSGKVMVGALAGEEAAGPASVLFEGQEHPEYLALLNSPLSTGAPSIGGSPTIGSALTCSQGSWAEDRPEASFFEAPASYAYQWLRDGSAVTGATSAGFTPTEGGSYSCQVTAANEAGSTVQSSAATSVPAPAPTAVISAPASGGTHTPVPVPVPVPKPVSVSVVKIVSGKAIVKGGHARVRLACEGDARCAGKLVLKARVRVSVKHGRRHRRRMVTIVVGRASFSIRAGDHATVAVKLSAFARRALASARDHRVKASAIAKLKGGKKAHREVRLLEKLRRHAHHRKHKRSKRHARRS